MVRRTCDSFEMEQALLSVHTVISLALVQSIVLYREQGATAQTDGDSLLQADLQKKYFLFIYASQLRTNSYLQYKKEACTN